MLECLDNNTTTQRHDYVPIPPGKYAKIAKKKLQTDETLISGHFKNNLQVNGIQLKSKVWPSSTIGVEEYKEFVKRLECCKKEVYKLYFKCPDVDADMIERMLRDLEKSTYQFSYSPNEYMPRKQARRFLKMMMQDTNMKYYATTYGTYYNRVQDLIRFKDVMLGKIFNDGRGLARNELKKMYKLGTTSYNIEYCIPAIEVSKRINIEPGPIDRYTLRRI